MKVNAQSFFNFCSGHVPLLRKFAERDGEFSEMEVLRLARQFPSLQEELPENTWRRLRELQILVPSEPGGDSYFLAEPVGHLLSYLSNEANPATPEMIRGYVQSLDTVSRQLASALEFNNVPVVTMAFSEISQTLRRIHANLEETHKAILSEVGRYKTERQRVSVREKFRRIVFWMERYVEPMIDIVRADGPLRATFDEVERLLRRSRDLSLYNDYSAVDRNLRLLRLVGAHALRVFIQCRKEIQPLYESLRRSSAIAEGASRALEKLQNEGIANWGVDALIGICFIRYQNVPGDAAISLALQRVADHPAETAPTVDFQREEAEPLELGRRLWLNQLPERVRPMLPVNDVLGWLIQQHPEKDTTSVLAGFGELVFHRDFNARFLPGDRATYTTVDGQIEASPVQLHPL